MPQLDGIRAFAVAAVIFEHFGGAALNRLVPIGAGPLGVNLFFTLSGFLITGLLLDAFTNTESKAIAWRDFYVRRLLRLTPMLYLTVAALALMGVGAMASTWHWHAFYASNFLIASGGAKTVFWSLAVEEQFYLLWPFVIAFAPRRWLVPVCAGMFLTAVLWKISGLLFGLYRPGVNTALLGNLEPLAVGCFLAIVSFRGGKPNQLEWFTPYRRRAYFHLAAGAFVFSVVISLPGPNPLRYLVMDGAMAVAYGWLVLSAAVGFQGTLGTILLHPAAVYIGKISYGLYVVHNWTPDIIEKFAGPLPKYLAAPACLLLTFAVCSLSFKLIETPIRNLSHRLPKPRSASRPCPEATSSPKLSSSL